jgi:mannan endo-1,6-alpha-mannosidase
LWITSSKDGVTNTNNVPADIKRVASIIAYDMMTVYKGNESGQTPGLLPIPEQGGYYWWEAGAMFGSLIDYWYYTNDTTYNQVVTQGMLFQVGEHQDYQPRNQTKSLGNDDQGELFLRALHRSMIILTPPSSILGHVSNDRR